MVTILYKCSRKMDEKNKEVKEIHFKLNKMESEVAKTCKESLLLFYKTSHILIKKFTFVRLRLKKQLKRCTISY